MIKNRVFVVDQLTLQKPSIDLFQSFEQFCSSLSENGDIVWEKPENSEMATEFIARLLKKEIDPPTPLVPETIYWATINNEVVGRISLRHRLAGNLFFIGGHIGYEVHPKFRRKGVAKEMLRQVLETSKAKEIGKLLLTCSPNNAASNKTIMANGGTFDKKIFVELIKEDRNHYWIHL